MSELAFGIDVGGSVVAICAVSTTGAIAGEVTCDAAPHSVIEKLKELGAREDTIAGVEAGGCALSLTRKLRESGFQVRVLETRYVSRFLKVSQNKTDRNDARGIAEMVRLGASAVPDVMIKSEAIQMLRSELVLRHRMMAERISLENALRGTLRINGGHLGRLYSGTHFERLIAEELDRLRAGGVDLREVVSPVAALLVQMRRTIERMNRRLAHIADELDVCKRFMTIPGVGTICALSFYTAIADPHRFERNADVGPYLGLVPRISQSGGMMRSGRISRMGNTMTRTHLVSAAKAMLRLSNKDSDARRWALKILERSGRGKAQVALARKLATIMLAMWKSGEPFRADLVAPEMPPTSG